MSRCDINQAVALDILRRPKSTPVHELERYVRCKDCSEVRSYLYKAEPSHRAALEDNFRKRSLVNTANKKVAPTGMGTTFLEFAKFD